MVLSPLHVLYSQKLTSLAVEYELPLNELIFKKFHFLGITEQGIKQIGDRIGTAHLPNKDGVPYILLSVKNGIPLVEPLYKNKLHFKLTKDELRSYDEVCLDYFRLFYQPIALYRDTLEEDLKRIKKAHQNGVNTVDEYRKFEVFWKELQYLLVSKGLTFDDIIWKKSSYKAIGLRHSVICKLLGNTDNTVLKDTVYDGMNEYVMEFEYINRVKNTFVIVNNCSLTTTDITSVEVLASVKELEIALENTLGSELENLLSSINILCDSFFKFKHNA